tara:strand:+ start:4 stop:642 length:639 start_codon:yes stop_codon:yes gene_type:complete
VLNKRFITFEGGEGSGKSTQIRLLEKKLSKKYRVIITREPGGTREAELIRNLLVRGKSGKWSGITEVLLNFTARKDHVEKIILPNLKKNKWVICDRFSDSTLAYQGYGRNVSREIIKNLNKSLINNLKPALTFLLDIDPKIGLSRSKKRPNNELRYENMPLSYHKKIRNAYLDIAKKNKKRIKIIDASLDKRDISEIIWSIIQKEIKNNNGN